MNAKVVPLNDTIQLDADVIKPGDPQLVDPRSQDGLALSFCAANPLLRYVAAWGQWYQFDGRRWGKDDILAVYNRVRKHCRLAGVTPPAALVHAIQTHCRADERYAATVDQWDRDPWLLATPAGTVDLRTSKCRAAEPSDYLTKLAGAPPTGDCPTWHRFLSDITGGDQKYIDFLQRVAGYCATGITKEHALFFLYGTGGNGKGTFVNTLQRVLGDHAVQAAMDLLLEHTGERHPTDLADLRGRRLVIAQESDEGRVWNKALIQTMTGGDRIRARHMRQDSFEFMPQFKLLIASNNKPRLRSVDPAITRRFHLLPFEQQFIGDRDDKDIETKLRREDGGILRWIIQGAKLYAKHGLRPPRVVTDATAAYLDCEDIHGQWLEACCERGPKFMAPTADLFRSWSIFAEANNERTGRQREFTDKLLADGLVKRHSMHGNRWDGVRLKRLEGAALAEVARLRRRY